MSDKQTSSSANTQCVWQKQPNVNPHLRALKQLVSLSNCEVLKRAELKLPTAEA